MSFKFRAIAVALIGTGTIIGGVAVANASTGPTSAAPALSSPAPVSVKGIDMDYLDDVVPPTQMWLQAHTASAATFVKNLGANTVMISVPIFTSSFTSNSVYSGVDPSNTAYCTPSIADLTTVITALQSAGLEVVVRPLLEETNIQPSNWRGSLAPTDRAAWFASYRATISPFLQLSSQLGVKGFTVQSEMQSLNSDPHWSSLIAWAHTQYAGQLVWNPDLLPYVPGVITRPTTTTSLDYYPIVNLPDSATITQLVAGWNTWWTSEPRPVVPMQTTMAEVGILAQDGVYPTPWAHSAPGAFNQSIQSNWITAACQFYREHHFGGILFWDLNLLNPIPSLTVPNPSDPSAFQPLALTAIKSCFAG